MENIDLIHLSTIKQALDILFELESSTYTDSQLIDKEIQKQVEWLLQLKQGFLNDQGPEFWRKAQMQVSGLEGYTSDEKIETTKIPLRDGTNQPFPNLSHTTAGANWDYKNFLIEHLYFLVDLQLSIYHNKFKSALPVTKTSLLRALENEIWITTNAYHIYSAYENVCQLVTSGSIDAAKLNVFIKNLLQAISKAFSDQHTINDICLPCGYKTHGTCLIFTKYPDDNILIRFDNPSPLPNAKNIGPALITLVKLHDFIDTNTSNENLAAYVKDVCLANFQDDAKEALDILRNRKIGNDNRYNLPKVPVKLNNYVELDPQTVSNCVVKSFGMGMYYRLWLHKAPEPDCVFKWLYKRNNAFIATKPLVHEGAFTYLQSVSVLEFAPYHSNSKDNTAKTLEYLLKNDVNEILGPIPVRNNQYVIRPTIITTLLTELLSKRRVVLKGLPGTGKTQVAKYLAYGLFDSDENNQVFSKYSELKFRTIIWIDASNLSNLVESCRAIAAHLAIILPEDLDGQAIVTAVKDKLEGMHHWLLILDNASREEYHGSHVSLGNQSVTNKDKKVKANSAFDITEYFPRNGHILITSVSQKWPRDAQLVPLEPLNPKHESEQIMEFFRKAHHRKYLNKPFNENSIPKINTLANKLSYYPLALAQAAAYIYENLYGDIDAYTNLVDTNNEVPFSEGFDYPLSYQMAIGIPFKQLLAEKEAKRDAQASLYMLGLSACLAPNNIPMNLIKTLVLSLHSDFDEKDFNFACTRLVDWCLMEVADGQISLHQAIQKFALIKFSEQKSDYITTLLKYFANHFVIKRSETKQQPDMQLVPHIESVLAHARTIELNSYEQADLLSSVASYYRRLDLLDKALTYYQEAEQILKKLLAAPKITGLSASTNDLPVSLPDEKTINLLYGIEVLHHLGLMKLWQNQSENTLRAAIKELAQANKLQLELLEKTDPRYQDIYYTQRSLAHAYLKLYGLTKNEADRVKAQTDFKQLLESDFTKANDEAKSLAYLDWGRYCLQIEKRLSNNVNLKREDHGLDATLFPYQETIDALEKSLRLIDTVKAEDYSYHNKQKDQADILADLGYAYYLKACAESGNRKSLLDHAVENLLSAEKALFEHYSKKDVRKMTKVYEWLAQVNVEIGGDNLLHAKHYIKEAITLQKLFYGNQAPYVKQALELEEKIEAKLQQLTPQPKVTHKTTTESLEAERQRLEAEIKAKSILNPSNYLTYANVCFKLGNHNLNAQQAAKEESYYKAAEKNYADYLEKANLLKSDAQSSIDCKVLATCGQIYHRLGKINHTYQNKDEAQKYYEKAAKDYQTVLEHKPDDIPTFGRLAKIKHHQILLNRNIFLLNKYNPYENLELFCSSFAIVFVRKVEHYHNIKTGINIRPDSTDIALRVFENLSKIIPNPKIEFNTPFGKAGAESDVSGAIQGLFKLGADVHKNKKHSKAGEIIARLGLDKLDHESMIIKTLTLLFGESKENNDGFLHTFVTIYKTQINELSDKSVIDFAKFCTEELFKYLAGSHNKKIDFTLTDKKTFLLKCLDLIENDIVLQTKKHDNWSARELLQESGIQTPTNVIYVRKEERHDKHNQYGFRQTELAEWQTRNYMQCKDEAEAKQRLEVYQKKHKKSGACLVM